MYTACPSPEQCTHTSNNVLNMYENLIILILTVFFMFGPSSFYTTLTFSSSFAKSPHDCTCCFFLDGAAEKVERKKYQKKKKTSQKNTLEKETSRTSAPKVALDLFTFLSLAHQMKKKKKWKRNLASFHLVCGVVLTDDHFFFLLSQLHTQSQLLALTALVGGAHISLSSIPPPRKQTHTHTPAAESYWRNKEGLTSNRNRSSLSLHLHKPKR